MTPLRFTRCFLYSILFGCLIAPALRAKPDWGPVSPAELAETAPKIEPQAAAEILDYQLKVHDSHDASRREMSRRIRYKIYDPARAIDITRIHRLWYSGSDAGYELEARLTLPDGTTHVFRRNDIRKRDVAEEGRANGALGWLISRSDWRIEDKFLAISGVVKGCVLDVWEWEGHLDRDAWLKVSIQQEGIPIRHFEYIDDYSPNPEFLHRFYVRNPNGGKMTEDKSAHVVRFSADNLPSIVHESHGPPESYYSLTIIEVYEKVRQLLSRRHAYRVPLPEDVPLSLGPWAFFSTSEDYYDADTGYVTRTVKRKAEELTAGATTDEEKARRIYDFVQSVYQRYRGRADLENWYTRYVEDVDELIDLDKIDSTIIRRQDFHYLFIALLRGAGLECHTLCMPDRTAFPFSVDLVSPEFLDFHAVLVKLGNTWAGCAPCTEVPLGFGKLPWQRENQPALVAMPQKQMFVSVASPPAESSSVETVADLTLTADGDLAGECTRTYRGHSAHQVRERLHRTRREQWWQSLRELLDLESSSAEARLLSVDGLDTPEKPVRIRASLRWPAYAEVVGHRLLLAPAVFNQGLPPLLTETERRTPAFFPFPLRVKDSITIHLPPGVHFNAKSHPIAAHLGPYAYSFALSHSPDGSAVLVERESVNRAIEVPVDHYRTARDWFRQVATADQAVVVLVRH